MTRGRTKSLFSRDSLAIRSGLVHAAPVKRFWPSVCFLAVLSSVAAEPLRLSEKTPHSKPGPYIQYRLDPERSFSLEQVRERPEDLSPLGREMANFGYSKAAYWFRLKILNDQNAPAEYVLEMSYPAVDQVDFYTIRAHGNATVQKAGDFRPYSERDIGHNNPVMQLSLGPLEGAEIWIRVASGGSIVLPFHLYTRSEFLEKDALEKLFYGAYFGIMIIMFVYNFFLSLSLRSLTYLYYILYIFFLGWMNLNLSGLGMRYLWPESPDFQNRSLPALVCLAISSSMIFSARLLNSKQMMPVFHKLFLTLAWMALVPVFISPFGYFDGLFNRITQYLALLFTLILFSGGLRSLVTGYKPARYFFLAWFLFLLSSVAFVLRNLGVFPSTFLTDNGLFFGSVIEVALLSLALADRINLLRSEKEEAQQIALRQKSAILEATARFVPEQFIAELNRKSIEEVSLGDAAEKDMTVLFADIRSFTTLSEQMGPRETFQFLNDYLAGVVPIVRSRGGHIDKYVGDALLALFPGSAIEAIQAAIAMHKSLENNGGPAGQKQLRIGTGIHTGKLIIGTVGEAQRMDVTVISDAVNVASRLEHLTKDFACRLIVSAETLNEEPQARSLTLRFLGTEYVTGRNDAVQIFEVLDADRDPLRDHKLLYRSDFEKAVNLYETGSIEESARLFQEMAMAHPDDGPARAFHKRAMRLLRLREGKAGHADLWQ